MVNLLIVFSFNFNRPVTNRPLMRHMGPYLSVGHGNAKIQIQQYQFNPDIREFPGHEKKCLKSAFCLFCLGKYENTSYNAFYLENTSLFNSY